MTVRILAGDCRDVLKTLPEASVDAIVTDPPYHLTASVRGATPGSVAASRDVFARVKNGGFMGMKWDGGDIAQDPAMWAECLRVLKPGGYLLSFGGTRTYHRMVCAIEDAGFEVRDMLAWLYGSGFPKGTDKAKIPAAWQGWNTALKPAFEPICLARKAMEGTLAMNLAKWGTGAMNVDGCRVAFDDEADQASAFPGGKLTSLAQGSIAGPIAAQDATRTEFASEKSELGRWPANVTHDGSAEVLALFPSSSGGHHPATRGSGGLSTSGHTGQQDLDERHGDTGSAARFFYCAKASRADRNDGLQGAAERVVSVWGGDEVDLSAGKKSTIPRANNHPTVKPTALMRWLVRLVTPPGGTVLDPFMGSGSTLKAAELEGFDAIGIELDPEYAAIARLRIGADAPLFSTEAAA